MVGGWRRKGLVAGMPSTTRCLRKGEIAGWDIGAKALAEGTAEVGWAKFDVAAGGAAGGVAATGGAEGGGGVKGWDAEGLGAEGGAEMGGAAEGGVAER